MVIGLPTSSWENLGRCSAIWAASAANDLLIAETLVYLLYRRRSSVFEKSVFFFEYGKHI
jgi:hypothetical protein